MGIVEAVLEGYVFRFKYQDIEIFPHVVAKLRRNHHAWVGSKTTEMLGSMF